MLVHQPAGPLSSIEDSRSAEAFAAYDVVALDCARPYRLQQLFELKWLRYEADARLMSLEVKQEPAATD